jgi:hypothetical protein
VPRSTRTRIRSYAHGGLTPRNSSYRRKRVSLPGQTGCLIISYPVLSAPCDAHPDDRCMGSAAARRLWSNAHV